MSTMPAVTTVTYPQHQCRRSKRHGHKITSERKQELVTHLNLADYLYDLELGYRQGDRRARQPEDQLRYELRER